MKKRKKNITRRRRTFDVVFVIVLLVVVVLYFFDEQLKATTVAFEQHIATAGARGASTARACWRHGVVWGALRGNV